jgi:hypothetical protein
MPNSRMLPIAIFMGVMVASGVAQACRCIAPKTPEEAFARADAVVLAEVLEIDGKFNAEGGAIATLRAAKAWKSGVPATLKVETRTTCAFDFRKGETYLVYLSRSGHRAQFATTICDGNLPVSKAGAALQWLGKNKPSAIGM